MWGWGPAASSSQHVRLNASAIKHRVATIGALIIIKYYVAGSLL